MNVPLTSYYQSIDKQIELSRGRNLFFNNSEQFQFGEEIIQLFSAERQWDARTKENLIEYATAKSIEEFCRINQYYAFDQLARKQLRKIYAALLESLLAKVKPIQTISKEHHQRLRVWLTLSNPFAEKIYKQERAVLDAITCAEYSAELQINVLRIDIDRLIEPVLDIGCGKDARLVTYLRNRGIDATGIDRFALTSNKVLDVDWLDYNYGKETWGSIISNLGFSNHFIHHHLREDGNFVEYGKTYMAILKSLQVGGTFYYAPDLPFIERYLEASQFNLIKSKIDNLDYSASKLTKLTS